MSTYPASLERQQRQYFRQQEKDRSKARHALTDLKSIRNTVSEWQITQCKQARFLLEEITHQSRFTGSVTAESLDLIARGIHEQNQTLAAIEDAQTRTAEATFTLGAFVAQGIQHLSEKLIEQQQSLEKVLYATRQPYQTKASELLDEADKWMAAAEHSHGNDRDHNFRDALGLLRGVVDNPVGKQDYVAWFQMGLILWKTNSPLVEVEGAFDTARRLSAPDRNQWHIDALHHLAEVRHQQHNFAQACSTIQQALALQRDGELLLDAARYASSSGNVDSCIAQLEACVYLQPLTFNTMLGVKEFQPPAATFTAILQLAERILNETRLKVSNSLDRWRSVLGLLNDAQKELKLTIFDPRETAVEMEMIATDVSNCAFLCLLTKLEAIKSKTHQIFQAAEEAFQKQFEDKTALQTKLAKELSVFPSITKSTLVNFERERDVGITRAHNTKLCTLEMLASNAPKKGEEAKLPTGCAVVGLTVAAIFGIGSLVVNTGIAEKSRNLGIILVWVMPISIAIIVTIVSYQKRENLKNKAELEERRSSEEISARYNTNVQAFQASQSERSAILDGQLKELSSNLQKLQHWKSVLHSRFMEALSVMEPKH